MKLDQYMAANRLTDVAFAAKVGVASTTVMRWRRNETRPDWAALASIAKATKGAVTPNDFLSPAVKHLGGEAPHSHPNEQTAGGGVSIQASSK